MGLRHFAAACAAAMACAATAHAGVIISTLPPASTVPAGDWDATDPVSIAGAFSLSDTETIRGVQIVVDGSTDTSWFGVSFFDDNGGQPGAVQLSGPGSVISATPFGHGAELVTLVIPHVSLSAGDYWFDVVGDPAGAMSFSGSGSMLQCSAFNSDCQPIPQTMAFDLLGDPGSVPPGTPEPTTWVMLLLGIAMLGTVLRLSPRPSWSTRGAPAR